MEETLDFNQTHRIFLLIDLNPLFSNPNTNTPNLQNPYIQSILSAAQTIFAFEPLSSALFAFKFFFSSLSPILSTSKLDTLFSKSSISFSFDRPAEALDSLTKTLNSISKISSERLVSPTPRAGFFVGALRQVVLDCTWESAEDLTGKLKDSSLPHVVRSNLVLLFSPVVRSLKCLAKFVELDVNDELEKELDSICGKFGKIFGSVSDMLVSKDIHCSWVDVNYEVENEEDGVEKEGALSGFGVVEKRIKRLGWGFCSTDAIGFGSAIVPFGLIYPNIGCSIRGFCCSNNDKKIRAELRLKISDVSKKPLESKCCDLELVELNVMGKPQKREDISRLWESSDSSLVENDREKTIWGNVGDQIMKISVKEVWRSDERVKLKDYFCDYVLLQGFSAEHRKEKKGNVSEDFFADHVLEMLQMGGNEFSPGKPIWQVFLSFLYRQNYRALVSISHGDEISFMGILKPFTIHSALLCVLDSRSSSQNAKHDFDGLLSSLVEIIPEKDVEKSKVSAQLNHSDRSSAPCHGVLTSKNISESRDGNKKTCRKSLKVLKDLSWTSFCKAASTRTEMDLEDVYFTGESSNSRKFRFLQCWMKQAKRSCHFLRTAPTEPNSQPVDREESVQRLDSSKQESEQAVSSSFSTGELSLDGSSNMNRESVPVFCSENPETFFSSISQKIELGLESKEVDLGAFAERLVESCIYWLYWKHEKDNMESLTPEVQSQDACGGNMEILTPEVQSQDACGGIVADELAKLLLRKVLKYKSSNPIDSSQPVFTSEYKVREYELQILFRMEILCSKVQVHFEESAKQKMVKEICTLLQNILHHNEQGFFGDFSLDKYVRRTIKNRYSHCLGDVVDRIYSRMDLTLYNSDEGVPVSLNNSEDFDASQRNKMDGNEIGENSRQSASSSAGIFLPPKKTHSGSPQRIGDKEHKCSLIEAQERREWARRRSSFTTIAPLQRVFAPKQTKAVRKKPESLRKLPKRKARHGACYDMVCETPMTGKRSCIRENSRNDKQTNYSNNSSGSVSKALFQDSDDV